MSALDLSCIIVTVPNAPKPTRWSGSRPLEPHSKERIAWHLKTISPQSNLPLNFIEEINTLCNNTNNLTEFSFSSSINPLACPQMSDDEPDLELLALLRQHLRGKQTTSEEPETGVLEGAEYVYNNAIDCALDMRSCKNAAAAIYEQMQVKSYSPATWATHELHPKTKDEATLAFIFTMDLLNFSFWSEKSDAERFAIFYKDRRWTGYWSLVAALQRALEEGGFPYL